MEEDVRGSIPLGHPKVLFDREQAWTDNQHQMKKSLDYIKTRKLTAFLALVVLYFIFKGSIVSPLLMVGSDMAGYDGSSVKSFKVGSIAPSFGVSDRAYESGQSEPVPASDAVDRKVITNSNFSLLVKNVTESIDKIKTKVTQASGFVIDSNIRRGETYESADLTLRIPSDKIDEVSAYLRSISVKVVSENVSGNDITDQYVDIEGRIRELQAVKAKLEQIMNSATGSDEMLRVFRQINDINSQIDLYKGRLTYMDRASSTSRLTVALSTDELSLPYSPAQPWRPEVVFKTAVRSLLTTLQSIGTLIIWVGVYIPLIILLVVVYLIIKKVVQKRKIKPQA